MRMLELMFIFSALGHTGPVTEASITPEVREIECLARNIFFESRGEDMDGKKAVGHVTLNRVNSKRYPDNVCDVVWELRRSAKTQKQVPMFSWTLDGRSDKIRLKTKKGKWYKRTVQEWVDSIDAAVTVLGGDFDYTYGATHYYAHNKVTPYWKHQYQTSAVIGDHTFMVKPSRDPYNDLTSPLFRLVGYYPE